MNRKLDRKRVLDILRRELPYLRGRFGVERLALYGSFARGTATETSDVDLLVQLDQPLGFEFVALAERLEHVLGRKVDLATFQALEHSLGEERYRHIACDIQGTLTDVTVETG